MKKIIFFSILALAFSQQSFASIKKARGCLENNGMIKIHTLNNAIEIRANQSTACTINAYLQFRLEGSTIRATSGQILSANMIERSDATNNSISLIERSYDNGRIALVRIDIEQRKDGRFFVRFIDRN